MVSGNSPCSTSLHQGKEGRNRLKTVDAPAIWKRPRSCHGREGPERDCHQSHPGERDAGTCGSRNGWMRCLRPPRSSSGLCWPLARPPSHRCSVGHVGAALVSPFLVIHGQLLWAADCKAGSSSLPPRSLCQWTFCRGGYVLVRAILMNLNLLWYSVFLFFQKAEVAAYPT